MQNSWEIPNIEDNLDFSCVANSKYQCPKCKKLFAKNYRMIYHFEHQCTGRRPSFKCPYCNFVSKYSSATYRHVRRHHPNEQVSILKYF